MSGWRDILAHAGSDMRRGMRQSVQDVTVAKLVVMPFALTLVVLLGWMLPLNALASCVLFALLMIPATTWNAGWRARTGF